MASPAKQLFEALMKEAGNFASYNYRCAPAFALALRPCQRNSHMTDRCVMVDRVCEVPRQNVLLHPLQDICAAKNTGCVRTAQARD
jgi:hypothetical protein